MPDFVYVWEFRTSEAERPAFEAAYGPGGEWVRLFRRASGFKGTQLLRDRADPLKFLTVDRWTSEAEYVAFRERFAADYAALDGKCERMTVSETLLGTFDDLPT